MLTEVNTPKESAKPTVLSPEQAKAIQDEKLRNIGVDKSGGSGIIKNIRLNDIEEAVKNSSIKEEVVQEIYNTLSDNNANYYFDKVISIKTDPKIVMQTNPIPKGTFFDTVLNLNENFLGGKTVEQLDKEIKNSTVTVANSLSEAVTHEIYHSKLIFGLNMGELEGRYQELSEIVINGISPTASKDGAECIAEVGVLFKRNETDNIPQKAKDLFNKYMEEKI